MNRETQQQIIIRLLLNLGEVDNFYCIDNKIALRLGAIIHRLRRMGINIRTDRQLKNTVYRLEDKEQAITVLNALNLLPIEYSIDEHTFSLDQAMDYSKNELDASEQGLTASLLSKEMNALEEETMRNEFQQGEYDNQ